MSDLPESSSVDSNPISTPPEVVPTPSEAPVIVEAPEAAAVPEAPTEKPAPAKRKVTATQASIYRALRSARPMRGLVEKVIKGGFEIRIGKTRGFCPRSQMDLQPITDARCYSGSQLVREGLEVRLVNGQGFGRYEYGFRDEVRPGAGKPLTEQSLSLT